MGYSVSISCSEGSFAEEGGDYTTVAVDVLRATTTAITAVSRGRRCYPVRSLEEATALARRLGDPLLAGELGGSQPYGFDLQNSPAEIASLAGSQPVILLSTSGTRLLCRAADRGPTYAACLRNVTAQADHLVGRHLHVRLVGADARGEFREEDQLCCARIARRLVAAGYHSETRLTEEVLERWGTAPDDAFLGHRSSSYLLDTGQGHDIDFVLAHIDDLDEAYPMIAGELGRVACAA